MSDSEVVAGRGAAVTLRTRGRGKARTRFPERRRSLRPRLAEIRRGANLDLLPPMVVTGAIRAIEFLLVAGLGFAIYLGYVKRDERSAHLIYLAVVLTAAAANTLMLQTFDLYSVPALSAFVRSFTRIAVALDAGRGGADGWCVLRQGRRRLLAGVDRDVVRFSAPHAVRRATRRGAVRLGLDQRGAAQSPRRDRRRRARGGGVDQGP